MLHHIMCLLSTIKCSSQMLKLIECIRWTVIAVTFICSGICACKILKSKKFIAMK